MKYCILISLLFLGGCETLSHPFKRSNPNDPATSPPQPPIVDPIDLIVDGNNSTTLAGQSHIKPFLTIMGVVLAICLIPFLVVRFAPQARMVKSWTLQKYKLFREWVKKKIRSRKEKLDKPK